MGQDKYCTQWAAQFRVASDLSRRGYRVSLTLGNAESTDLSALSPGGRLCDLEVKGLAKQNFWLVRERKARDDLFFILVLSPRAKFNSHALTLGAPRFFIASSSEVMAKIASLREHTVRRGKKWNANGSGFSWRSALEFEDRWNILPA